MPPSVGDPFLTSLQAIEPMCGICGHINVDDNGLITRMTDSLHHRGPDDAGYFHHQHVYLGHRRLSIIDLSGGRQPMSTPDGRLTVVYNGEIYNYRELRDDLAGRGHTFQTSSDTEVLLRLFQEKGVAALDDLNGMFALAVYDRQTGEVVLARDRIGIKPLYYVELGNRFLFASEIKALLCYQGWSPTINPQALHDYLHLRYIPGGRSIIQEVRRLPAGHFLRYRNGRVDVQRYWEPPAYDGPYDTGDHEYQDQFEELMRRSVRRRMISDVSLGAYLSGGLDSSVIVALMSEMSTAPVKTFSVGFDYEHDELTEAQATANLLGCDHHEIACRADKVELLPDIVHHLDEPMGDGIIIPMYQLSRAASRDVKVILTGEGGDEILGGYLFHKVMWAGDLYRRAVPALVRNGLVAPLLAATPAAALNVAFRYPAYLGSRGKTKVLDYLKLLEPSKMDGAYRHLISLFDRRDVADLYEPGFAQRLNGHASNGNGAHAATSNGPYLNRLLQLQFDHWLPDNMLLRADKMGMAHSIEGRVPFLDHELVEFACRLPPRLKLRRLAGKYILRRFAKKLLPGEVANRRKMPFYVPVENYYENPVFQEMMGDLLSETSVRRRGLFRPRAVAALREGMQRREFLLVKQVFSLMVLELWFRQFLDRRAE